jgi:cellulose biosynthesis protein BcsQ
VLVLAVCSLKGGVGKTSVVLGLASAALAAELPTLVVDLDPQGDATTGLDVVSGAGGVADVLARPRRKVVAAATVPSGWTPDSPGRVDIIPGGPDSAAFDVPDPSAEHLSALSIALGKLDQSYGLVLVDCPPNLAGLTRTGLVASRRALVVSEPGLFSVSAVDRALRAVQVLREDQAPDLQPLGVVVNRVRSRSLEHTHRVAEMRALFGPLVLTPLVPERSALQQAQGAARPLHEWQTPAGREMAGYFDALLARALRAGGRKRRKRD